MIYDDLNAIIISRKGNNVKAIIRTEDWYGDITPRWLNGSFVVAQWNDFHDGVKSNIEGKVSACITNDMAIAELVYERIEFWKGRRG